MIYSESAFYWIPEEIGYSKVYRLLNNGGTFVRFDNHPFKDKENESLHVAMKKIYSKYMPHADLTAEYNEEKCIEMADTIKKYGFIDVNFKMYHRARTFDTVSYISLISTYSDHRAMEEDKWILFSKEIKEIINSFGGKINVYDTISLHLARKP